MNSIIEVKDVTFTYSGAQRHALERVSLAVAEGEFVGVIGPSGAGKSTLAGVMSGAVPHHFTGELYGACLVDGKDTCEVTLTDVSRLVGSVLQDTDAQFVASNVRDELLFGLENFGVTRDEIPARMQQALETVGIEDLCDREIATLSGGQKQKVAIAAILALRPRVLVLDEPTAALDPASSTLVFETLREVNRSAGITVVVIEQKVALLSEYCSRVVVFEQGKLIFDDTPRKVFSHGERLREIGVDSPRVARVSNSLAAAGLCEPGGPALSVDEVAALVARIVGEGVRGAVVEGACAVPVVPSSPCDSSIDGDSVVAAASSARTGEPVARFEGVGYSYPGGGASVRALDFEVFPGEIVGIVGQNGAGKTTFTKLLNGLLKPAEGNVVVAGLNTREVPTSRIARHVSTLFQNPDRQICKDTVLDEVAFGLLLQGVSLDEASARAKATCERFGLPLDEAPFSLSRGQRQMVALASVVVGEPQIIVLDEPTSGLDYRECMTVMETVRDMAAAGSAVVMVCHDMEVVSDFADRLVVMANGEILGRGTCADVFANDGLMQSAFVEPPQAIALAKRLAAEVSPAFAGLSEVSDIVAVSKELACRA
ncbi:ABC transporter ATP-binding protein [Slackia isoflavoniconvertens]|uniref:ABC transporter ATP-binding protein n=1 Tax=Slackia isoflavoniconvertens TaxID=572010 RepID=A0A3N0IAQ9_9ACTN|nr:energy-coupling factor transporter ATPase [Slackia isoflavoniconvertens]MBB3279445.1 energy-coupling factor transport system ATP-binding protein [Slackia isoflavoniconvertens]RNM34079.1 ABC transporter ATP-binding protein [Slackia isoflavoniconvertens]